MRAPWDVGLGSRPVPHVIAAASLKGGSGKTTISTTIAATLHAQRRKVLLVDADPQGTASRWGSEGASTDNPPVIAMRAGALRTDLPRVSKPFEIVVIDAPPRHGGEQRAAMLAAHLVLLPVIPGGADLWALQDTITLLEEARTLRPDLRAAVVCNRLDSRTAFSRSLRKALSELPVPALRAGLSQRIAHTEAMTAGMGVVAYAPSSQAAKEAQALTREVLRLIGA